MCVYRVSEAIYNNKVFKQKTCNLVIAYVRHFAYECVISGFSDSFYSNLLVFSGRFCLLFCVGEAFYKIKVFKQKPFNLVCVSEAFYVNM